ncbi:MAG: sensor domain-containing diguanylate cyclase [Planctomycetes bacterium]|nr:sensor domain-containing diguanylate cyclase [Planctomycetota bacterium]
MSDGPPSAAPPAEGQVRELVARLRFYEQLFDGTPDVIVVSNGEGRITAFNHGAEELLGWRREEVLGTPVENLYYDPSEAREVMAVLRRTRRVSEREITGRTRDSRRIELSITLSFITDEEGGEMGVVGICKDIRMRKKLERELMRLSVTDKLTGLYNQNHFYERLEIEKERALRLGHDVSLVLFDLDKFKEYNDTRGHLEGDKVLRMVGRVIMESIRKEVDSGFRYGGDEFTIILPGAGLGTAATFAERLREAVADLRMGGITASVGVAPFDRSQRGVQWIRRADENMYRAKEAGGNRVHAG